MDFFKLLKQEHQEAKDTFKTLLNQDEIDQDETRVLCQKLLLHMEMEEKYLYPVMEEIKKAEETAEEAILEHKEGKRHIRELMSGKLDEVEFKVKLEMLQLEIQHHADEEEKELFPMAKSNLSREQIEEISERMLALKEKKADTISA